MNTTDPLAILNDRMQDLRAYLSKWEEETRQLLGLSTSAEGSFGISFLPEARLTRIPNTDDVTPPGFYQQRLNPLQKVEVVSPVGTPPGMVRFRFLGTDTDQPQTASVFIFTRLFEPAPSQPVL